MSTTRQSPPLPGEVGHCGAPVFVTCRPIMHDTHAFERAISCCASCRHTLGALIYTVGCVHGTHMSVSVCPSVCRLLGKTHTDGGRDTSMADVTKATRPQPNHTSRPMLCTNIAHHTHHTHRTHHTHVGREVGTYERIDGKTIGGLTGHTYTSACASKSNPSGCMHTPTLRQTDMHPSTPPPSQALPSVCAVYYLFHKNSLGPCRAWHRSLPF